MGEFFLPQRSKHPREMVITPKASTSVFAYYMVQNSVAAGSPQSKHVPCAPNGLDFGYSMSKALVCLSNKYTFDASRRRPFKNQLRTTVFFNGFGNVVGLIYLAI